MITYRRFDNCTVVIVIIIINLMGNGCTQDHRMLSIQRYNIHVKRPTLFGIL